MYFCWLVNNSLFVPAGDITCHVLTQITPTPCQPIMSPDTDSHFVSGQDWSVTSALNCPDTNLHPTTDTKSVTDIRIGVRKREFQNTKSSKLIRKVYRARLYEISNAISVGPVFGYAFRNHLNKRL
ncbi:hypothetical protein V9T40_001234 [Parthenolecanium corni]|uniref:Uncharacterized protein n=1 Tax=Parthenolecanium corni TaxID=536013 RepID=A0AAN9TB86_9HEMI